jgi:hypothetical protein
MVDLATTKFRPREWLSPSTARGGGQRATFTRASQTVVVAATPLNMLPPTSTDGVDRLYY